MNVLLKNQLYYQMIILLNDYMITCAQDSCHLQKIPYVKIMQNQCIFMFFTNPLNIGHLF